MGDTNKWIILQDDDKALENTEFVGDQNTLITNMLARMKEDKSIGEKMLKKRMATKKEENEQLTGKDDSAAQTMINTNPTSASDMSAYRQRRLELGEDDILNNNVQESYSNIPILNNVDNRLDKKMIWARMPNLS